MEPTWTHDGVRWRIHHLDPRGEQRLWAWVVGVRIAVLAGFVAIVRDGVRIPAPAWVFVLVVLGVYLLRRSLVRRTVSASVTEVEADPGGLVLRSPAALGERRYRWSEVGGAAAVDGTLVLTLSGRDRRLAAPRVDPKTVKDVATALNEMRDHFTHPVGTPPGSLSELTSSARR